eukprot:61556_1
MGSPPLPNREYVAIPSSDLSLSHSPLPLTPTHEQLLNKLQQQQVNASSDDNPRTASLTSSILNLTSSVIGSATLGMPFAMSKAGIVIAFALILFFAGLTMLSLYFLMYCSSHFPLSGHSSFYNLSTVFLPKPLQSMMDIAVVVGTLGWMVSYLMVSGDALQSLAHQIISDSHSILHNREILISLFVVVFILPVVQFKQLDHFKFVSIVKHICFAMITVVIVLYALVPHAFDGVRKEVELQLFPTQFLSFMTILPIYTFGFLCHQNAFSITNELSNSNMNRLNIVNVSSISIVVVVYALISMCSYYSFGDKTLSDALDNYPQDKTIFIVTRLLLAVSMLFTFPVSCHPARESISSLIFKVKAEQLSTWRYNVLTYAIVFVTYGVAMVVQDIAMVFSFIGATSGTIISYIYPGLIYYFMFKENSSHRFSCAIALLLCVFGCVMMPFSIVCIFLPNS